MNRTHRLGLFLIMGGGACAAALIFFFALSAPPQSASGASCFDAATPPTVVSRGQSLQAAINSLPKGGVIWVGPGRWSCITVTNMHFTASSPLIIRKDPTRSGTVTIKPGGCYYSFHVLNSSYVVLDGLTIVGGGSGLHVTTSDHVILNNLDVSKTQQEGISIDTQSNYVDLLNSHIHNTGTVHPQWSECVYVGTGNSVDNTEHVWIQNNEMDHCGLSEGIDIKGEVFHTTAIGNNIHNITPGTPTQYNMSALTVEGEDFGYEPTAPRDVWVENNTVHDVSYGRWAYCMMGTGTGVHLINNTIYNCPEGGITINTSGNLGLFLNIYRNNISSSTPLIEGSGSFVTTNNPGPNPNTPQTWYCPSSG